jgi:hypothetical protein
MKQYNLDSNLKQLITIINGFYTFFATFFIPESTLKRPPPGGWPNITLESTASFGKSQCVIDLIKYLPYIDEKDTHEMTTNIHYRSDVIDYPNRTANDFADASIHIGELSLKEEADEMRKEPKPNRKKQEPTVST